MREAEDGRGKDLDYFVGELRSIYFIHSTAGARIDYWLPRVMPARTRTRISATAYIILYSAFSIYQKSLEILGTTPLNTRNTNMYYNCSCVAELKLYYGSTQYSSGLGSGFNSTMRIPTSIVRSTIWCIMPRST